MVTSALPQWPKLYASINLTQCYTSYCPYVDTDDLQQMTPVCIVSSVVVGLEPPHVNLFEFGFLDLIHLPFSI